MTICAGDEIGGVADTVKFDEYFNTMALVNQATGNPGPDSDNGQQYAENETLVIQLEVKSEVTVQACIQPMGGGNSLPLDESKTFSAGQASFDLGSFQKGNYVIRVIVDNILVKNFPFNIQ
jgi:hypothetical protein